VYSAGRYGNVNSKCDICFVTVKELRAGMRDIIASTKSNTVRPHV